MASNLDLKLVVKHLADGTIGQNLCCICLLPLQNFCESIYTKVCKENQEYCIADVLQEICNIKFSDNDHYNVCSDCFITASAAYKFYLQSKRSEEILSYYIAALEYNIGIVETPEEVSADTVCISLPAYEPLTKGYNFDLEGLSLHYQIGSNHILNSDDDVYPKTYEDTAEQMEHNENIVEIKKETDADEDIIIIMQDEGQQYFFKHEDGNLVEVSGEERTNYRKALKISARKDGTKIRRKRHPMTYKMCSKCPVKYRFVAKLKEHMKTKHNIELFICKVCKAIIEDEQEFHNHLKTHTNTHTCAICNMVFKRRETIIAHIRRHEEISTMSMQEGAHVCEICGQVLRSAAHLEDHYDKKHDKKYTCYYCGRMYKGELSFEMHVKKHEMYMKEQDKKDNGDVKEKDAQTIEQDEKKEKKRNQKYVCSTCGRNFVDERALLWHNRLHTNERPYVCDVCGRGFVSVNRRNQHAVCAHTAPTRRCPLCPALFHLRSMVNTHLKKVHLKAHKRRNRTSKYQDVFWRTEPVPIQELSVSIQNDILELQSAMTMTNSKYNN